MTHVSGHNWIPEGKKGDYSEHDDGNGELESQQGKPMKTVIGVVLLAVLALVLARMNPAPHDVSNAPAMTTGETTGSVIR